MKFLCFSLIIFILSSFCLTNLYPYPQDNLRNTSMSQDSGRINQFLFFMSTQKSISVGVPNGQVRLRVCKLQELSEKERDVVSASIYRWLDLDDEHKWLKKDIIEFCRTGKRHDDYRNIYLAISDPDVNGKGDIEVEGVVTEGNIYDREDSDTYLVRIIDVHPLNRGGNPRFKGVATQLVCFILLKGLIETKCEYFELRFNKELTAKMSERLGLKIGFTSNTRREVIDSLVENAKKVLKYLADALNKDDEGATEILKQLRRMSKKPIFSYI